MYGHGSNLVPPVSAVVGTAAAATVLPTTGMNLTVELALSAAAGLAVWAVIYMLNAKLSSR